MSSGNVGAASAPPQGGSTLSVRSFLLSPFDPATWRAFLAVLLGPWITLVGLVVLMTIWSIGGSLIVILVGIPLIGFGIESTRYFARVERWRMDIASPRPLTPHVYKPLDYRAAPPWDQWLTQYATGQYLDVNRWRDVVYTIIAFPLALLEFLLVVVLWAIVLGLVAATIALIPLDAEQAESLVLFGQEGVSGVGLIAPTVTGLLSLALIVVASFVTRGVANLHRIIVETLLCVSPEEALREEAERLRASRSAAVEYEASELRRIERDLHDGAQQRLVRLALDLGRAEDKIDSDPDEARRLVRDSRDQARTALAELRDLVRGAAPSILIDRGLAAAIASIAGRGSVQTFVDSSRVGDARFSPAVERAGYFVASEALANVAKHSGATRADVIVWRDATRLFVEIWDNGGGGADAAPDGGLAGLHARVQAIDGTLQVVSPPGGPTMIRAILPLTDDDRAAAPTVPARGRPAPMPPPPPAAAPPPAAPPSPPTA
jgi:signal transduction histidine kinase